MEPENQKPLPKKENSILHGLPDAMQNFSKKTVLSFAAVITIAGFATGYAFFQNRQATSSTSDGAATGSVATGNKIGIEDKKTFRDCAKGQLENGGLSGEGTHHLVREGGPSQTAYLTSSVVDLGQFVGKAVEVCGETIASKKAGWLMDVGLVNPL